MGWLGLTLDAEANGTGAIRINEAGSPVWAWAIPTDEEAVIARHTLALAV
jgi:acetate kinase